MPRLECLRRRTARVVVAAGLLLSLSAGLLLPPAGLQLVSADDYTWVTFLGGAGESSYDEATCVAVDGDGYIYVTGQTEATWSATGDPAPVRPYSSGAYSKDAYVAKLEPDGDLVWYTFLGGEGNDMGAGIAVDSNYVYVTGRSDNYAWSQDGDGSPVRAHSVSWDAFVARLGVGNGVLDWHTFLGGSSTDTGSSIAVDADGNVFVAGISEASWGAGEGTVATNPVRAYESGKDVFAAALDAAGALQWSTFLGGSGNECLYDECDIAVDNNGNVYVAGNSPSDWGSSPVREYSGGEEAFVAKLEADAGSLTTHTFLGSYDGADWGHGIAVDAGGDVYVTGYSNASWGVDPIQEHPGGNAAIAVKLADDLTIAWHTFLGGGETQGNGICVDSSGNVYVAGSSWCTWGSPEHAYSGQWDVFAAKLSASGALAWNTFAGGGGYENAFDVAFDDAGALTVCGDCDGSWASDPVREYSGWADGLAIQFNVPLAITADVDIDLVAGWNMVSVPVEADDMSVNAIFPDAEAVYTWNPGTKSYGTPATIDPKKGYWVAVTSPDTVTVTGTPVTEWTDTLTAGWNMAGSVHGDPVDVANLSDDPSGSVQTNAIYHWNPTAKSYAVAAEIRQGLGYWMAATQGCDLTVAPSA